MPEPAVKTGELGFEPRLTGSEPDVLPLHHSPMADHHWQSLPDLPTAGNRGGPPQAPPGLRQGTTAAASDEATTVPVLEFQSGVRSGERFVLDAWANAARPASRLPIVLDASSVSRQHAALTISATGVTVEDLRSRNGTLVNGVPLSGPRRLEAGDELSICGQRFVLFDESPGLGGSSAARRRSMPMTSG